MNYVIKTCKKYQKELFILQIVLLVILIIYVIGIYIDEIDYEIERLKLINNL